MVVKTGRTNDDVHVIERKESRSATNHCEFHAFAGTGENPTTEMAGLEEPGAGAGVGAELSAAAVPVGAGTPALERTALASAGVKVSVLVEVEPETVGVPAELDPVRANWARTSGAVSMNAMVGPAMILSVAWSRTLLASGWLSEVMKIATGPLMPSGTTHWSKGRAMANAAPPTSIWHAKPCGKAVFNSCHV